MGTETGGATGATERRAEPSRLEFAFAVAFAGVLALGLESHFRISEAGPGRWLGARGCVVAAGAVRGVPAPLPRADGAGNGVADGRSNRLGVNIRGREMDLERERLRAGVALGVVRDETEGERKGGLGRTEVGVWCRVEVVDGDV